METASLHKIFLHSTGLCTDTRVVKKDNLFFALKGDNFNANQFAAEALEKGASYAVIDDPTYALDGRYILVEDSLQSLQDLAKFHRRFLGIPIVGLTGSNGKTTTKEMIREVLSTKYRTSATKGNLNNHIGVPLSLLAMDHDVEIGIIEMGANHQGEIALLTEIAQPDLGYVTNFGKAHLEGFGGYEGVIKGKSELYDFLKKKGKAVILNYDDPIQQQQQDFEEKLSFGSTLEADLKVEYLNVEQYARIKVNGVEIDSNLIGRYNAPNIAAAVTIGHFFGVPFSEAKRAIEAYIPANNRSQVIEKQGVKIILDAYNANPTSMAAALENLMGRPEPRKIAVLGDMFELGPTSPQEHQAVVDGLEQSNINQVILVGEHFHRTSTNKNFKKFRTVEALKEHFSSFLKTGGVILIKGSRGMALERLLEEV